MLHEDGSEKFSQVLSGAFPREILIIVGPEGGISDDEVASFVSAGAHSTRLGKPVFRSAHAGVAALSALQSAIGIW